MHCTKLKFIYFDNIIYIVFRKTTWKSAISAAYELFSASHREMVTNTAVLVQTDLWSMFLFLFQHCLWWLCHVWQHIPKGITYGELAKGHRVVVCLALYFKDFCKKDLKLVRIEFGSWKLLADNCSGCCHTVWGVIWAKKNKANSWWSEDNTESRGSNFRSSFHIPVLSITPAEVCHAKIGLLSHSRYHSQKDWIMIKQGTTIISQVKLMPTIYIVLMIAHKVNQYSMGNYKGKECLYFTHIALYYTHTHTHTYYIIFLFFSGVRIQKPTKDVESILVNVSGKLLMFQPEKSSTHIKEDNNKYHLVMYSLVAFLFSLTLQFAAFIFIAIHSQSLLLNRHIPLFTLLT